MRPAAELDHARANALAQIRHQLLTALDLCDQAEEFLLSAQIALALDTVHGALVGLRSPLREPREIDTDAG